jgi:hypothetical protein
VLLKCEVLKMFKIIEEGGNEGDMPYELDGEYQTYQGAGAVLDQNPSYKRDGMDTLGRAWVEEVA